jgi:hypothetical protein
MRSRSALQNCLFDPFVNIRMKIGALLDLLHLPRNYFYSAKRGVPDFLEILQE